MKGLTFAEKPGPVHPNCKCEVRWIYTPTVAAYGLLQGFDDAAVESFGSGQKITVEIRNLGPLPAGARLWVDKSRGCPS
ncbi:MAG: hypothetical protein AB7D51_16455 [Desulfovibrionaceae bacterium]